MYNLMMTNPTIPSYMPRKKEMQSRMGAAAQTESAHSNLDSSLASVEDICNLIGSLPISEDEKFKGYAELMFQVANDDELSEYEKGIVLEKIKSLVNATKGTKIGYSMPTMTPKKDIPDTYYDPEGVLDNPEKSYTAKPMMVTPDAVLRYSAMATLNLYNYMGMPCLICVAYDFGICTYTSDITYEFIMELAKRDGIDKIYFTDGKGVAIVK